MLEGVVIRNNCLFFCNVLCHFKERYCNFNLLSANALNLDKSKISGKEFMVLCTQMDCNAVCRRHWFELTKVLTLYK